MMKCVFCKKEFTPIQSTQKFCSAKCRRAKKRGTLPPNSTLVCAYCDEPFITSRKKKYCSDDCAKKAARAASYAAYNSVLNKDRELIDTLLASKKPKEIPKNKKIKELVCAFCDTTFYSTRLKKYCCSECRLQANGKAPVEKYEQNILKKSPTTRPKETLAEAVAKARELGLTYGKYISLQYLEKGE